ncbi:hypothetical protein HPB49_000265 [Dermacentor silvarum]|uniref:Uncharacterized protein n=2 Tax=Dermacentor silvarum TaxID=543639 RepID=A0ACB8CKD3_DERSI|nr:hypothetical protein HPB49_009262 [Dermacentor silvarum]KAH7958246.1 hypothetical protein HPB49_000265 [Dermacentor silvarum]
MDTDHENEDQMEDASGVEEDFLLPDGVINGGSATDAGNSAKEGQWKIALSLRTRKQLKRQARDAQIADEEKNLSHEGQLRLARRQGVEKDNMASSVSVARHGAHAQENYRGRSDKDFVKPPVQNGTMLGSKAERSRPRRRPPPLPRNDMKIVIRPKPGLAVKDLQTHQVARAISQASGSPQECRGEDFLLRLRPGSNIIVVSTPYERTAELVMKITSLNIQGKQHPVNAYISTPEHLLKGVIHGIDEGTTEDELMANLRVRTQGVKIMHARMFGKTRTAIILFDGPIVPRYVYYYGGEIPCRIYQPTRQFCYTCRNAGHRADVCPEPTVKACKNCNLQNPEEGHKCEPECALCGGVHVTAAPECRNKLKRVPPRGRPPTQPTKKTTKHQSRPKTENIPKKRWLSSDRDGSSSPERSRSRSKSGSRTRSGSRGNKQPETKPQQQKKKKEANSNEVSWAAVASHHKPQPNTTQFTKLERELELMRIRLGDLERENAQLKKQQSQPQSPQQQPAAPSKRPRPQEETQELTEAQKKQIQDMLIQILPRITEQVTTQLRKQMQDLETRFDQKLQAYQIEISKTIRKQTTGSTIRERAEKPYSRPGLAAMSQESNHG